MEAKMKIRYDLKGLRCGAVFTTSFSFITSTSLITVSDLATQTVSRNKEGGSDEDNTEEDKQYGKKNLKSHRR